MTLPTKVPVALLLLSAPVAAADNPHKVAIGPGSTKGALLLKVPPLHVAYQLHLLRTDPTGSRHRPEWIYVDPVTLKEGDRFVVATLPAGEYLLEGIAQQRQWLGCLEARTLFVRVHAGQIAYLGKFDPRPTLESIQRNAAAPKERIAHFGQWHRYRSNIAPPSLSDRNEIQLGEAQNFVRARMPKSTATTVLAGVSWGPYATVGSSGRPDRCF